MSDRRERQLEIVLKLNKLTKQGTITWVDAPSMPLRYSAKFKNRSFLLTDQSSVFFYNSVRDEKSGISTGKESKLNLLIRDDDKEIWIPPMPAIDDLARTVHHQITKGDTQDLDEVLKDLEEAENLLED